MGWNGNILTAAVGWGNISDATHQGGPPYTMGAMVANSSQINMWAKWKPFKYPSAGWNTTTQQGAQDRADAAASRNYGIAIPTETSFGDITYGFLSKLYNQQMGWYYDKPTAGAPNEWFRALDFDGYQSDARALTLQMVNTSYSLDGSGQVKFDWPLQIYDPTSTTQIRPFDLKIGGVTLDQCYFGAFIHGTGVTDVWSAPSKYADVGASVTFTNFQAYAGKTVDIVPFISTIQLSQGIGPGSAATFASWNVAPIQITIGANVPTWTINGTCTELAGIFAYSVRVTNNSSSSQTMEFHIWLTDDIVSGSTTVGTNYVYQTVTVAAGSYTDITGRFVTTIDPTKNYAIGAEGTSGSGVPRKIIPVRNPSPE